MQRRIFGDTLCRVLPRRWLRPDWRYHLLLAFTGLRDLFPRITLPTPIQQWAQTTALPDGPVLAVIEDLNGQRKDRGRADISTPSVC